MKKGSRVVYSLGHWTWMRHVGRARAADVRMRFTGTVHEVTGPTCTVVWDSGRPWPLVSARESRDGRGRPTRHLTENLQASDVARYQEEDR